MFKIFKSEYWQTGKLTVICPV